MPRAEHHVLRLVRPARHVDGEVRVVGADLDALVARDAVEERQVRPHAARHLPVLRRGVARIAGDPRRVGAQVRERGRAEVEAAFAGVRPSSVRERARVDERLHGARAFRGHRSLELLHVLGQARVTPGPEQIGAGRDRHESARQRIGEVVAIDAAGEGELEAPRRRLGEPRRGVDGQDVERRAGEVHLLLVGEEGLVVLDHQRVRELRADGEAARGGHTREAPHHRHHLVEGRVTVEGRAVDGELVVAERAAEESVDVFSPEDGGVHLHNHVRAVLDEEVLGDALDLVRRAAVEGGEGDAVEELVGNVHVLDAPAEIPGQGRARGVEQRARVAEAAEPRADGVALDPRQRVADGDLELRGAGSCGHVEEIGGDVQQVPARRVLEERLRQGQLLRPLHIEAHVLRVDAGAGDVELVENLDRLELEDARSAEPRQHHVLRELRVRARRGTHAGRGARAVVRDGEVEAGARAAPDLAGLEVVDGAGARVLDEHAAEEVFEALRNEVTHGSVLSVRFRDARSRPSGPTGAPRRRAPRPPRGARRPPGSRDRGG